MPRKFGKVVKQARQARGETLREVAKDIRWPSKRPICLSTLQYIETGVKEDLTDSMIEQFASRLDLDRLWLYYCANMWPPEMRDMDQDAATQILQFCGKLTERAA